MITFKQISMSDLGILELEGMEFRSYHGCLERERAAGNDFIVDFRGTAEMGRAAQSDSLEDAVDYSLIYETVAREMAVPSNLIEHVAGRIVRAIADSFPQFTSFSVRVSKKRPPVNGVVQWSRVTLIHTNEELI